ncbi:MAG: Hpt domain-containing protein, partial [Giesbergeria sp.]
LDMVQGLRNALGRPTFYAELLHRFIDSQGGAAERIAQALAQGDKDQAARDAHTLRGLAGTVGAISLQDAAGQLEDCLRGHADPVPDIHPLVDALRTAVDALVQPLLVWHHAQAVGACRTSEASFASNEQAHAMVAQLHGLLQRDDPAARSLVRDHAALLTQALGPALVGVQGHIEQFDFEPALAALSGWLAQAAQMPEHRTGQCRKGNSHAT